eukprot:CAMPEP_0168410262 /NCGR_PEP_ID=MMETSP0228-20121227/27604_1 /TAXON_ID=133427 /ORGANISM="Protoceratium reticulatum, Strain CCCM 535 (=CCMP 1889)" /LENGTH=152 /DNA_ID=CAMNT_0008423991 /DNA_START=736 /DNA_END=1190 /DNA_ORIENTATION=-
MQVSDAGCFRTSWGITALAVVWKRCCGGVLTVISHELGLAPGHIWNRKRWLRRLGTGPPVRCPPSTCSRRSGAAIILVRPTLAVIWSRLSGVLMRVGNSRLQSPVANAGHQLLRLAPADAGKERERTQEVDHTAAPATNDKLGQHCTQVSPR